MTFASKWRIMQNTAMKPIDSQTFLWSPWPLTFQKIISSTKRSTPGAIKEVFGTIKISRLKEQKVEKIKNEYYNISFLIATNEYMNKNQRKRHPGLVYEGFSAWERHRGGKFSRSPRQRQPREHPRCYQLQAKCAYNRVSWVLSSKLHAKGSLESTRGAINALTKGTQGSEFILSANSRCSWEYPGCYPQSSTPKAAQRASGVLSMRLQRAPGVAALRIHHIDVLQSTRGGEFMISANSRCPWEYPGCNPLSPRPNTLTKGTLGAILKAPCQRQPREHPGCYQCAYKGHPG